MGRAHTERRRWGAVLVVAAAAAFAVSSATHLISRHTAQVLSNHAMTLFPLTAGIICVFVVRTQRSIRRAAWTMLAAWGLLSATGNAIWEYYEFVLHRDVPFPSLADAGYLCGNLCAVAAIVLFAVGMKRTARMRTVLDAAMIAGAVFVMSWAIVLHDVYANSSGRLLSQVVGLAYPAIDIVIVSLIVFVLSRSTHRWRSPLMTIGIGLLGWAFADSAFALLTTRGTYYSGHPADAGWIGGDALIALAAYHALRRRSNDEADETVSAARSRLPYVVVSVALVVGAVVQFTPYIRKSDGIVLGGIVLLLILVVVRQFLLILDNQHATIQQMRSIDEMKNGILNAVSHELRTPLTYVKGTAYMLQDETLPDEIKKDLIGDLVRSADRLEETLTGLLDLGRLSRGVLEPSRRSIDLTGLLLGIAEEVRTQDHAIRIASPSLTANVDPVQVERIVENLFNNALRHTPPGTEIVATAERTAEGVLITVADDGPGVPEDKRDEIFKAFVQSDHTVQFGRGTGVGLSIVTKFAELHGGRAWVEESASGGAKFCVLLGDGAGESAAVA